jgi:predicted phage terminase large subunit-like protein
MQRLHHQDLTGKLLKGSWKHVSLPAIAPEDCVITLAEGRIHHWKKGEALHSLRLNRKLLDDICSAIGPEMFRTQYLQTPLPPDGGMLKRPWLKEIDSLPPRCDGDYIVQSWDTANKAKLSSDYSVCLTILVQGPNELYLSDVLRERLEFPELKNRIVDHANRHQATAILIEDQGSGTPLIQMVQRERSGVVPIKVTNDKATRMLGHTSILEGGALHIPKGSSWYVDFLAEYLGFPQSKHDDQIDALSQFLKWHQDRVFGGSFTVDWGWEDDGGVPSGDAILAMPRWPWRR